MHSHAPSHTAHVPSYRSFRPWDIWSRRGIYEQSEALCSTHTHIYIHSHTCILKVQIMPQTHHQNNLNALCKISCSVTNRGVRIDQQRHCPRLPAHSPFEYYNRYAFSPNSRSGQGCVHQNTQMSGFFSHPRQGLAREKCLFTYRLRRVSIHWHFFRYQPDPDVSAYWGHMSAHEMHRSGYVGTCAVYEGTCDCIWVYMRV
jgi:hypothetical protein